MSKKNLENINFLVINKTETAMSKKIIKDQPKKGTEFDPKMYELSFCSRKGVFEETTIILGLFG